MEPQSSLAVSAPPEPNPLFCPSMLWDFHLLACSLSVTEANICAWAPCPLEAEEIRKIWITNLVCSQSAPGCQASFSTEQVWATTRVNDGITASKKNRQKASFKARVKRQESARLHIQIRSMDLNWMLLAKNKILCFTWLYTAIHLDSRNDLRPVMGQHLTKWRQDFL